MYLLVYYSIWYTLDVTAIIFIIVLSIIVFVHELGHFVMAKRAGMKVEEFGFGFPPRLWGHTPKNSETTYSINWIPFGGFVKIVGENESETRAPGTFGGGSFWQKFSVVVAGVVMNVILAAVLFILINGIGTRTAIGDKEVPAGAYDVTVQIVSVAKGSPAELAGLKAGDTVKGFDTVEALQSYVNAHRGQEITINDRKITPRANPPAGEGALGVALARTAIVKYPWHEAIWRGLVDTWYGLRAIVGGFVQIIGNVARTGKAGADLAGPVGIAVIAGQAARTGFTTLMSFVAFISLNLAVINLVPFPALDGGRLLFLIIEKLKGSPIPKRIEQTVNNVGFVLLLTLMVYITVKDVVRFF